MEFEAVAGHVEAGEDSSGEDATKALAEHGAEDRPDDVIGVAGGEEEGEVGLTSDEVVAEEANGVEADDEVEEEKGDEEKVEVVHHGLECVVKVLVGLEIGPFYLLRSRKIKLMPPWTRRLDYAELKSAQVSNLIAVMRVLERGCS